MPAELTALAPAKLNLVLEVLGKRNDGFHEVDTILQTLELADVVTLSFGAPPGVVVSGPYADGTPADESNLVWRAADALVRRTGRSPAGLRISLEKRIPSAGGLGGGASDAATVLRLLQRTWDGVTHGDVAAAAAEVGSDEPFFVAGGTARARGRGELVTPLPPLAPHDVVLFVPPETLERKTARMFAAIDALPFDGGTVAASFAARTPRTITSADVYNAFERVAFELFDGLADLWEGLEAAVEEPVRLAGAGPTLFWIGPRGRGEDVAARARGLPCATIVTRTSDSLWTPSSPAG